MPNSRKKLIQTLYEKLGGVYRGLRGGRGQLFNKYGLGRAHAFLVFAISHHPDGVAVKDLATTCHVTSGAITQQIDALVTQGLLERVESTKDRRIVLIKLTTKARQELDEFKQAQFDEVASAFEPLSDAEVENLTNLLAKIDVDEAACNCDTNSHKHTKGK